MRQLWRIPGPSGMCVSGYEKFLGHRPSGWAPLPSPLPTGIVGTLRLSLLIPRRLPVSLVSTHCHSDNWNYCGFTILLPELIHPSPRYVPDLRCFHGGFFLFLLTDYPRYLFPAQLHRELVFGSTPDRGNTSGTVQIRDTAQIDIIDKSTNQVISRHAYRIPWNRSNYDTRKLEIYPLISLNTPFLP